MDILIYSIDLDNLFSSFLFFYNFKETLGFLFIAFLFRNSSFRVAEDSSVNLFFIVLLCELTIKSNNLTYYVFC